jgi:hypothetical protein
MRRLRRRLRPDPGGSAQHLQRLLLHFELQIGLLRQRVHAVFQAGAGAVTGGLVSFAHQ